MLTKFSYFRPWLLVIILGGLMSLQALAVESLEKLPDPPTAGSTLITNNESSLDEPTLKDLPAGTSSSQKQQASVSLTSEKETPNTWRQTFDEIQQFKICSLGHKYNRISEHEFVKSSKVGGVNTVIQYASRSDDQFQCQISVGPKGSDSVNLKCWRGYKLDSLSTFKLSYHLNDGFLFVHESQKKLAYLAPLEEQGKSKVCPKNFKRIRSAEKKNTQPSKKSVSGLAGLTF